MRNKTIIITMVLVLTLGIVLTACGSKTKTEATQPPAVKATAAPATGGSDGQALLNDRCTKCHGLERVTSAHKSADQWTQAVSKMVQNGAKLSADEQKVLVDYLTKTYGP